MGVPGKETRFRAFPNPHRSRLPVLLTGLALVLAPPPAQGVPEAPPPTRAILLYTGGVAGELRSCGCSEGDLGGLAVRAGAMAALRAADPGPIFVLDSGDTHLRSALDLTRGDLERARRQSEVFARFHSRIGLDALVPGELDLALGADHLAGLYPPPAARLLAANLRDAEGGSPFPATAVIERQGFRLGLVAAVGEFLALGPEGRRLHAAPSIPEIGKGVAGLRRQGVHLVVLLSHLGLDEERRVARAVRGLDLVIGGHSRDRLPEPIFEGRVGVVQAGTRGKWLGRVEVTLGDRGPDGIPEATFRHQLLPMAPGMPTDQEVAAWVDSFAPRRTGPRRPQEEPGTDP